MSTDYTPPTFTRHVKTKPPDTLYHYTGQLGGITQTAELWATKIQYMNDATEFHRALSMACNQLDVMVFDLSNDLARKAACQKLRGSLSGLGDINIFVACFCEHGDLLSQWRGYSENSAGCSIGFDAQQLDESASRDGFILGRCIYDGAVQREIITEMITHIVEEEVAGRVNWGFTDHWLRYFSAVAPSSKTYLSIKRRNGGWFRQRPTSGTTDYVSVLDVR
jgi:hypothetical protein